MKAAIPTDPNKTASLCETLRIFKGAKVMLRVNKNVSKGHVNGAIGTVTEILWPGLRRDKTHLHDIPDLMINFDMIAGLAKIEPISLEFPANRNHGTAQRFMLPVFLCYACTVHKLQGSTGMYIFFKSDNSSSTNPSAKRVIKKP